MKLLVFVTQFYRLGGAERLAVELALAINDRSGMQAELLSMYDETLHEEVEGAAKVLREKGIPSIHYLGMPLHPGPVSTIRAIWELRRLVRRGGYDVVECSMAGPATLACLATLGLNIRLVIGLHRGYHATRNSRFVDRLFRFSARLNRRARFYAISKSARRFWCEFSGTSEERTRVIYNAIEDDSYRAEPDRAAVRQELGLPKEGRVVLYVGRLMKIKGIDMVLDALGPILKEKKLYLVYVGEYLPTGQATDDPGLVDRMKLRIADKGWGDHVLFAGRREDIPRLMASSDLLVHAPLEEGFGLVLAEALAAGLPVVATEVDGIPEVLEGSASIMVPPGSPDLLREAVLKTLDQSPEKRAEVVEKGRAKAQSYRWEVRVEKMLELFSVGSGSGVRC